MLRSAFDNVRFLVKGFVHSYNWYMKFIITNLQTYPIQCCVIVRYHPELALGGCVMKYTRTLYPELMQMRLSYENVSKYLRSLYFAIYGYITEMINENRQDIENEQQRIGIKVAEMTLHDVSSTSFSPSPTTILSTASSSSSISSSRPINHVKSSAYNYNDGNFNYVQKFRPLFSHHRDANDFNQKFSITQNYENELEVAQSFNDFSPRTRSMDIFKFDKNNFRPNSINAKEYDASKSFSLETEVPFDLEKFETKHSDNYNVPAADSSSSSSSSAILSTTSSANTFDLPENDRIGKFSKTLAVLENNLNVQESHKRDGKPNKFSVMYIGPRQFSADYQDDMSPTLDDTPTLDLNKNSNSNDDEKGAGDDDSNIFDFENVILESFGFNAKAVKSSSLARCFRGYVKNLFQRTFEYFILM